MSGFFSIQSLRSLGRILFSKHPPAGVLTGYGNIVIFPSTITPEQALKCSPVHSAVSQISSGIGEIDFYCDDNHAMDMALRKPNEWQTASELQEEIVEQMLLYGHSFVGALPNVKSPMRLACYSPREIDLRVTRNRGKSFVNRTTGEIIPPNEMIHFQDKPGLGWDRPGRLDSIASKIHGLIWADRLTLSNFRSGVNVNYQVTFQDALSEEAFDRAREMVEQFQLDEGSDGGGVMIIEKGGEIKAVKGLTASDVDLRAMVNQFTIAVAAAFETPPFMVGASDSDTKYSNTTARTQAMYRQAYSPKIKKMKRTYSQACGSEVKARDDVLQRGDFPQMVDNGVKMVSNGIMTANEVRGQWFNLEPHEDGDELRVSANATDGESDRRGEHPTDDGNPATDDE